MASQTVAIETQHEEMIHDAQMDYYGKRLATASSDRLIKIFEVSGQEHRLVQELRGHDGPVWQVAWSHPSFGNLLASCSYDCRVIIWKEEPKGQWAKVFEDTSHKSSVNSVAWAPHTLGLHLAAGSSDGTVSVFSYQESTSTWINSRFDAHLGGVNAVSWSPDKRMGDITNNQAAPGSVKRLATGGCDKEIKIWTLNEQINQWEEQKVFGNEPRHTDWVRDVQWAPSLGLPSNTIASCSEDKTVAIWTESKTGQWQRAETLQFDHKVWTVSWSTMGDILAVSQGDNKVSLWKESLDGKWQNLTAVDDSQSESAVNEQ